MHAQSPRIRRYRPNKCRVSLSPPANPYKKMFNITEILEKIDWDSGFHLPVANEENQELEAQLKTLFIRKAKAKFLHDNAQSQFEELRRHLTYVQQEAEQYQKLITTHSQQINDEKHQLKTLQANKDRVKQDLKHMSKTIEEVKGRQNVKRADLTKSMAKLEKLKRTAWDVEALEGWEFSLKKRDQDNAVLKKFAREDESRANDFEAKRQHVQVEVVTKRALLDKTITEVASYEQAVEKAGKSFKLQVEEKFGLIERWQDAVRNLHQRNEDINRANREMNIVQETIAAQEEMLEEQNNFWNNEKNNNKVIEEEIAGLNSIASTKRKELSQILHFSLALTGQVNCLKRITHSSSHNLDKERKRNRLLQKALSEVSFRVVKTEQEIEEARSKLQEIEGSSVTSVERLKYLEQIKDSAHKTTDGLLAETERVQCALHKAQVHLKQEKDVCKVKEMQLAGSEMSVKLLTKRTKQTLNRLELHKELIHALNSKINEAEVKIAELQYKGDKNGDPSHTTDTQFFDLQRSLLEHTEVKNFLQEQITRIQEKMRKLRVSVNEENTRLETLRGKLREQMLLVEGGTRQIAGAKARSQTLQVEENVIRLKLSRINKSVSEEDQNIYDLQKFRLEMETAQREREIEVETHREVLAARKKNLDETRGRLRADIKHRQKRVQQFKEKYGTVLETLGKDENGQCMSIVHFTVKNAQEKHVVQEQGDELDSKIRKAEKEIIAIENTLKMVNKTNTTFRDNLTSIHAGNAEGLEMKRLEEEMVETSLKLRQVKASFGKKQLHIHELRESLQKLRSNKAELDELLLQKRNECVSLQREKNLRTEKMKQATNLLNRKRILKNVSLKKYEVNLRIECLVECNEKALRKFVEFYSKNEESAEMIKQYLTAHKLYFNGTKLSYSHYSSSRSSDGTSSRLSNVILSFSQ